MMINIAMQSEPDFDIDIKEDVEEECSKYGRVKHIFVDKYVNKCLTPFNNHEQFYYMPQLLIKFKLIPV